MSDKINITQWFLAFRFASDNEWMTSYSSTIVWGLCHLEEKYLVLPLIHYILVIICDYYIIYNIFIYNIIIYYICIIKSYIICKHFGIRDKIIRKIYGLCF